MENHETIGEIEGVSSFYIDSIYFRYDGIFPKWFLNIFEGGAYFFDFLPCDLIVSVKEVEFCHAQVK